MEKRRDRACLFEHKNRFRVSNFGPGEPGLRLYNMRTCLVVSSNHRSRVGDIRGEGGSK